MKMGPILPEYPKWICSSLLCAFKKNHVIFYIQDLTNCKLPKDTTPPLEWESQNMPSRHWQAGSSVCSSPAHWALHRPPSVLRSLHPPPLKPPWAFSPSNDADGRHVVVTWKPLQDNRCSGDQTQRGGGDKSFVIRRPGNRVRVGGIVTRRAHE